MPASPNQRILQIIKRIGGDVKRHTLCGLALEVAEVLRAREYPYRTSVQAIVGHIQRAKARGDIWTREEEEMEGTAQVQVDPGMAIVSVFTENGSVDLPSQVPEDMDRSTVMQIAIETVRGGVDGIRRDVDLSGYEIDRLEKSERVPFVRYHARPKATFG